MATLTLDREQPGWHFWLLWMGASIAGVIVYVLVIPIVVGVVSVLAPMQQAENLTPEQQWIVIAIRLLGSAALGAALGVAQWLVMRRYLRGAGWWVLATLLGYSVPLVAGPIFPFPELPRLPGIWMFLAFGVILGILQWLTLRGRVYQAGWWIAISIGGWLVAYALIGIAFLTGQYVEPFDMLSAFIVPVAVAGAGIILLLRRVAPVIS